MQFLKSNFYCNVTIIIIVIINLIITPDFNHGQRCHIIAFI